MKMTSKQRDTITGLVHEVYGQDAQQAFERIKAEHPDPELGEASALIAQLVREKKKRARGTVLDDGLYALRTATGVERFKVSCPRSGRWEGYVFIDRLVGNREVAVKGDERRRIQGMIEADKDGAIMLYGQETGICALCGRRLTDEASRERGVGPKCAERLG